VWNITENQKHTEGGEQGKSFRIEIRTKRAGAFSLRGKVYVKGHRHMAKRARNNADSQGLFTMKGVVPGKEVRDKGGGRRSDKRGTA